MIFTIKNRQYMSTEQLRTNTMLNAYFIIQKYPLKTHDILMDKHLQRQYKTSLKNICIKLLLDLTFYEDESGNLVLLFKNPASDTLASLITYGNGAVPGSKILQVALKS
jgi:hypothetical protein